MAKTRKSNKHWKDYELDVIDYIRMKFGGDNVLHNEKRIGKLSGVAREIDILIERQIADQYIAIAVECKKWKTKIDVADVGAFIDKLNDLRLTKGFMVSEKGFTEAAFTRAMQEPDLQLYVLDFSKLDSSIGFWGNPYRGQCGAFISAPSGWIVNATLTKELMNEIGPCVLYPMSLTLEQALSKRQLMYFNILPLKGAYAPTAKGVFEVQNTKVLQRDPASTIKMWNENNGEFDLQFRELSYGIDGYTEYSVGMETEDFVAYYVLIDVSATKETNFSKLKYMMQETRFIILPHADPDNSHRAWEDYLSAVTTPFVLIDDTE